jgi:hypothetical protein
LGDNNTFVINGGKKSVKFAERLRQTKERVIDR